MTGGLTAIRPGASAAAKARAKEIVRAQLRGVARQHIAANGAGELSMRAVARELGMTSSAVYRYFASREELIGSLVEESYEAAALAAEHADRERAGAGADAAGRWLGVARAIRRWAREHPHEFGLIYGTPTPTQLPMGSAQRRIWRVLAGVMATAVSTGALHPPATPFEVDGLVAEHVLATVGRPAAPFGDYIVRAIALFSALLGAIAAELSGQFRGLTTDDDRLFDLVVATAAQGVGLALPVERDQLE